MKRTQTVFVGLSGGVDSSVAALRLLHEGYNVVGVFIKVWQPDFLKCNWEAERLDAMRVAAHLDIPFLTCDAAAEYEQEVGEYFVSEYAAGRTPNPDVMCNRSIKFGAFLRFARDHGADFIATGHYAQRCEVDGLYLLARGKDEQKDQSYFLWTLTQEQLAQSLFPVGSSSKDEIRKEADAAQLPTATKKDSQGICFLGHVDVPSFLSNFIDLTKGTVVTNDGTVIGEHEGAIVYTLGQRHRFTVTDKNAARTPLYVVSKDIQANTITVAPEPPQLHTDDSIELGTCNWITGTPVTGTHYHVQFRYRQTPITVRIESVTDTMCTLKLITSADRPAAGQSCVLYDGDICLGGGVIS